jgi:hypothetical protein
MARVNTGVSKKENRENLAALALIAEWRNYGEKGFSVSPEFAWAVSGGKFGKAPVLLSAMPLRYADDSPATIDAVKLAKWIMANN